MLLFQKCLAELIGTYCLVFAGTGAIIVNELHGNVSHVGIALTFGLIVMAMIYAIDDDSGAHINPAVTIGFWLAGRIERAIVVSYIAAQLLGAILASLTLRGLSPGSGSDRESHFCVFGIVAYKITQPFSNSFRNNRDSMRAFVPQRRRSISGMQLADHPVVSWPCARKSAKG